MGILICWVVVAGPATVLKTGGKGGHIIPHSPHTHSHTLSTHTHMRTAESAKKTHLLYKDQLWHSAARKRG